MPTATLDQDLAKARQCHADAARRDKDAAKLRAQRDRIVKRLRARDPKAWTFAAIGRAVGCSPELVSQILKR